MFKQGCLTQHRKSPGSELCSSKDGCHIIENLRVMGGVKDIFWRCDKKNAATSPVTSSITDITMQCICIVCILPVDTIFPGRPNFSEALTMTEFV